VSPYKVIDMREIAKAFDLSVEQVEQEIAHLIVTKQIQAKIDSHSKVPTHYISNIAIVALFSQGQRDPKQLQGGCVVGHQVHPRD
jgi:histone acetyltransferase (RNA polymerase elongator complex component)